jgi:hypothetical protein
MKRVLIAMAVAAGLWLSAGDGQADHGGYTPPGGPGAGSIPTIGQMGGPNTLLGAGDLPPGRGPDMYGLHPCIKRFFHIPPGGRCAANGCAPGGFGGHGAKGSPYYGAGYGMGGPGYYPGGGVMQGTLVFPHHTFTRSPRDFFMLDLNK